MLTNDWPLPMSNAAATVTVQTVVKHSAKSENVSNDSKTEIWEGTAESLADILKTSSENAEEYDLISLDVSGCCYLNQSENCSETSDSNKRCALYDTAMEHLARKGLLVVPLSPLSAAELAAIAAHIHADR